MVIGLWLLDTLAPQLAAAILGIVLFAYCVFALARPDLRLPEPLEKPLAPVVGVSTGVLNGLTGSQV